MSASDDLYAMLGLNSKISGEELRVAYEGAVKSATRRGDWHRARLLSSAFDNLATSMRCNVYSNHGRHAPKPTWETPDSNRGSRRSRPRRGAHGVHVQQTGFVHPQRNRAARDAAITARWQMRRPYRVMAGVIIAMVAVVLLASMVQKSGLRAQWPLYATVAGCSLYGWLSFTVAGRRVRQRLGRALELVVWSTVAGLFVLILLLSVVNARA